MNKFSLRFTDSYLEQSYTVDRMAAKYQVCMVMSGMLILFYIITIIQGAIAGEGRFAVDIGMLAYLGLSVKIVHVKQEWADDYANPIADLIYAFNIISVFISIEYIDIAIFAIFTHTLVSVFRLYITILETPIGPRGYVFSILVFVSLIAGVYWNNHTYRTQYLLKLKDQKWQYLLPKLVDSTFYTFTFNEEQLRFELLIGSRNSSQTEFIQFIRQCKVENQTLENYCFTQFKQFDIQDCNISVSNQIKVNYNGEIWYLKYYQYFVTELNFMIVLDKNEVQAVKQQFKTINKQQLRHFNEFINQIMAMRKNSRVNAESTLRNMYLIMFQFQCRLWLVAGKMITQPIKFKALINRCLSMVPNGKVSIIIQDDFTIVTIKPLFVLMMIELLNNIKSQRLQIRVQTSQDIIKIHFNGQLAISTLQNNTLFKKAISILMVSEQYDNDGMNQLILAIVITLPLQLDLSYLLNH